MTQGRFGISFAIVRFIVLSIRLLTFNPAMAAPLAWSEVYVVLRAMFRKHILQLFEPLTLALALVPLAARRQLRIIPVWEWPMVILVAAALTPAVHRLAFHR